jgi:hypothetical protein
MESPDHQAAQEAGELQAILDLLQGLQAPAFWSSGEPTMIVRKRPIPAGAELTQTADPDDAYKVNWGMAALRSTIARCRCLESPGYTPSCGFALGDAC